MSENLYDIFYCGFVSGLLLLGLFLLVLWFSYWFGVS